MKILSYPSWTLASLFHFGRLLTCQALHAQGFQATAELLLVQLALASQNLERTRACGPPGAWNGPKSRPGRANSSRNWPFFKVRDMSMAARSSMASCHCHLRRPPAHDGSKNLCLRPKNRNAPEIPRRIGALKAFSASFQGILASTRR